MVLGRDEPGLVVDPIVVPPVDDEAAHRPARRLVRDLALEGATADERAIVGGEVLEHPVPAELDRRRAVGVVPGEAARVEVGLEEEQPGLDAEHLERGQAERQDAETLHRVPERVPDVQGVGRRRSRSRSRGRRCSRSGSRSRPRRRSRRSRARSRGSSPSAARASRAGRASAGPGAPASRCPALCSSIVTSSRPIRSANQAKFGSAEVRRYSSLPLRRMTPSSMTKPRSSSQVVYWAWPGGQVRMSRASMPARNVSASLPAIRYL